MNAELRAVLDKLTKEDLGILLATDVEYLAVAITTLVNEKSDVVVVI